MGIWLKKKPSVSDQLVLAASARARAEMLLDQMQVNIGELRDIISEAKSDDGPGTPNR